MDAKLLIVEDNAGLRTSLEEYFAREGFAVTTVDDGAEALSAVGRIHPDLVILDVQLPHKDGLEICQAIRQQIGQAIGIVMISGIKRDLLDRVVGLEVGADAYMTKPFETRELLAQARALLRSVKAQTTSGEAAGWLVIDDRLRIHFERRIVEAGGREVHLTPQEFDLLRYLVDHPGSCCARADLIDAVWPYEDGVSDAALNTCIARLRAKIEPEPANPRYIESVHGVGYRFKMPK
jgi:DNA-binding response OmpR family regulator